MQDSPGPPEGEEAGSGWIDAPLPGAILDEDPTLLAGWAYFSSGPAARVEVEANGIPLGRARVGTERFDVAEARSWPGATTCGFQVVLDLGAVAPPGDLTLRVTAFGMAGERLTLPAVEVRVGSAGGEDEPIDPWSPAPRPTGSGADPDAIRVLAFTHDLGYGGAQLYLTELLVRLRERGRFEAVVVTPSDGPLRRVLEEAGMTVHVTAPYPVRGPAEYEGRMAEFAAWAEPQGFTVVLANTILAWIGADLAERCGLPCLWAIHESYPLNIAWSVHFPPGLPEPYVRRRAERALAGADALIFEARATSRLYERYALAGRARLLTIPYGIPLLEIDATRSALEIASARRTRGVPEHATLLLCVASFDARKAQSSLVQAFHAVADGFPDAHLALVGDMPGRYSDAIHDHVRHAGLDDRVTLVPVTPDVLNWYGIADVLVIASDIESLPRTILQAMAFGVPVLATAVFGVPELIEDGKTGWLCAERDVGALRDALQRVLALTPEQRRTIGSAGEQVVRERHASSGYADAYHRLMTRES